MQIKYSAIINIFQPDQINDMVVVDNLQVFTNGSQVDQPGQAMLVSAIDGHD